MNAQLGHTTVHLMRTARIQTGHSPVLVVLAFPEMDKHVQVTLLCEPIFKSKDILFCHSNTSL